MSAPDTPIAAPLATPALRRFFACLVVAPFFAVSAGHAQTGQGSSDGGPVIRDGQPVGEPVNPATLSCSALKAKLQAAGQLSILSGPKGAWGDTFYGPAVPRCQFYQLPVFTYVRTADGRCGVGYVCADKLSLD